jgi:hypothetical protein
MPSAPAARSGRAVEILQQRQYDIAPDGGFPIKTPSDTATSPLTLILCWNPEVPQRKQCWVHHVNLAGVPVRLAA